MSDSSTLIETLSEEDNSLIEKDLKNCNVVHLTLNLPSGKKLFARHIMYYEIVDFSEHAFIPETEQVTESSYVGSN